MLDCLTKFAHLAAALSVAAFFTVATWMMWQGRTVLLHADGAIIRGEAVESKINASAVNLDLATKAWADSAKLQADAVTGLVTDAHGTLSEASAAVSGLSDDAKGLQGTITASTALLASAKGATDTLPAAIGRIVDDFDATQAPVAAIGQDATDLDALLKSGAVAGTLANVDTTTGNLAAATGDFQKRFHDLLYPPPCATFGCRLGRYVWPVIKDGASFGEAAYWTHALLTNQHP